MVNFFGDNKNNDNEKVTYLMDFFKQEYTNDINLNREMGVDIDNFLNKNENEMNLSNPLKRLSKESKKIIENSLYETDLNLFEICKLQVMLRTAKNSSERQNALDRISAFYKDNSKYIGRELPVLNSNGLLNKEEIIKMQEYSEAYQKIIILEHIDTFNSMTPKELENIDLTERKHMIMCAFSGLRYNNDEREGERELAKESARLIKQLYPNLDLNNERELADFFKEISGVDANFTTLSLQEVVDIYSRQLKEATESYIEKDTESYKGKDIDLSKLDLDVSERKIFESSMQNYFINSAIKFTKTEEDLYQLMYQDYTIDSWIQNKDDAIKLRYMALMHMKEKYKTQPHSEYISKKMDKLEDDIKKFEENFGKIDITEDEKEEFGSYTYNFINAGLTKYLTRDVLEWQDGKNYKDLDPEHKKGYIRNILVAMENTDVSNTCLLKLAMRRLELMNTNEKKFIIINDDGSYQINEELILQEYNGMSKNHTYADFEELKYSASLRKNEYLLTKLEEYTHLNDEDFLRLEDNCDRKKSMEQIEQRRRESNETKYIHGEKISDSNMDKLFEKTEELDVSATQIGNNVRSEVEENQVDAESDSNVTEGDTITNPLSVSMLDASAAEINVENGKENPLIGFMKDVLKGVKKFISKYIKGEEEEEEIKLIEAATTSEKANLDGTTLENNNMGYDINKQYYIDHNMAVNQSNAKGNSVEKSQQEVGGRGN